MSLVGVVVTIACSNRCLSHNTRSSCEFYASKDFGLCIRVEYLAFEVRRRGGVSSSFTCGIGTLASEKKRFASV